MIKICVESLRSVKENLVSRKNTFELFGYDFMIDESFNVWLIEVNSSPNMDHSTKVTERMVKKGLKDLGKLVHEYMGKGKVYDGDVGGWKLVCGK